MFHIAADLANPQGKSKQPNLFTYFFWVYLSKLYHIFLCIKSWFLIINLKLCISFMLFNNNTVLYIYFFNNKPYYYNQTRNKIPLIFSLFNKEKTKNEEVPCSFVFYRVVIPTIINRSMAGEIEWGKNHHDISTALSISPLPHAIFFKMQLPRLEYTVLTTVG